MNVKIRALLWEELRVGGAIAATGTAVGLLIQVSLRLGAIDGYGEGQWHFAGSVALMATLGIPVMTALLLILSAANSGHLEGGFSRRILRLPVDTSSTVLVVLITRLAEVLAVSAIMLAACWGLFHHGPGTRAVFLVAGIYLFIQLMDWLRAVAALLAPIIVLAVLGGLLAFVGGVSAWGEALASQSGVSFGFLLGFAASVALVYALSLVLVGWTRCGQRLSLFSAPSFDVVLSVPGMTRRKPFASPMSAQVWFELKQAGLFLPLMVLVFWLLANGVRWLAVYSSALENHSEPTLSNFMDPLWVFEIMPLIAFVLASVAWGLRANWGRRGRASRPAAFYARQPMTKARRVQARLVAAGINLGPTLTAIAVVSTLSFLLADQGQIARIMGEALAHGETNLREVIGLLAGPFLLAGLAAWAIVGLTNRFGAWLLALTGTPALVLGVAGAWEHRLFRWGPLEPLALSTAWLIIILPALLLLAGLIVAYRQSLISRRSLVVCVLLWAAVALGFFPFSAPHAGQSMPVLVLVSLALGALAILPYVCTVFDLSHRGRREPLARENPGQHRRPPRAAGGPLRAVGFTILVAAVAALVWMRWPAQPPWVTSWHAQGLPTNTEELNAWYASVPAQENLANQYIEAAAKVKRLESRWIEDLIDSDLAPPQSDAAQEADPFAHVLVAGGAQVERTEQILPEVWQWTKRYWDAVASEVCADLHAAAESGLTASRYPINLRHGFAVQLPHLAGLRQLARMLSIEAWVASVERRPRDAANAVLDILPLAHSLKDEPVLISQLVRNALYGIASGGIETAMNRVEFSEDDLERLQEGLARVLPPTNQQFSMDRAMIGEQALILDVAAQNGGLPLMEGHLPIESPFHDVLSLITDIVGYAAFERLIVVRQFARMRECGRDIPRAGGLTGGDFWDEFSTPRMQLRALLACILMPALERAYESEWRIRTQLDMARTAVAVERFRLAHGRLPTQLGDLVPAFFDRIPADPWNDGNPLSYRIKDNGEFVVYSYGMDWEDDRGEELASDQSWRDGDLTFTVAPPEIRDRPQVAP